MFGSEHIAPSLFIYFWVMRLKEEKEKKNRSIPSQMK